MIEPEIRTILLKLTSMNRD